MRFRSKLAIFLTLCIVWGSIKGYMVYENRQIYNDEDWEGGTVYLIPSTHADTYWKGEWAGPNIGILLDNIINALMMIDRNSDFRYTIDQAGIAYTFIMEYPEYKDKLARAIEKGQIEVAGGGVTQADLNLPSGEGLLRNFIIGNKWFEQEFGINLDVCWQVDTFGAPSSLPSILSSMDFKYMYYKRDGRGRPEGAYWWDGADGSQILCWKTHYGRYPITAPDLVGMIYDMINKPMADILTSGDIMLHIGGDKCAPLTMLMDYIETWNVFYANKSGYRVKVATPSEFFEKISKEASGLTHYGFGQDNNPVNEGLQTSYIETKVLSRKWENYASIAETFSTLGRNLLNLSSIQTPDELQEGWWLNSFLYHHDTVTGTAPDDIVEYYLNDYRSQSLRADRVLSQALTSFTREINIQSNTNALVVFNSESSYREEIVETEIPIDLSTFAEYENPLFDTNKIGINITDLKSKHRMPAQITSINTNSETLPITTAEIAFLCGIESVGYHSYGYNFTYDEISPTFESIGYENSSSEVIIWNGIYNITWNMNSGGNINSLKYKGTQSLEPGTSIGFAYADTSNDPYRIPVNTIQSKSSEYTASYELDVGNVYTTLKLNIPMDWYNLSVEYKIRINSSLIEMRVTYKHLEENGSIANLLLMNWPWSDISSDWVNGAPYGWTNNNNDASSNKPFPGTHWSIIENNTLGLGIYDRGIVARDWNKNEQTMSLVLCHQNDPYNDAPGTDNPLAKQERPDFLYDEIEQYTLEFGFEYYNPSWSDSEIPQKGRNFNRPLQIIGIDNELNQYLAHFISKPEDPNLSDWGSFIDINSTNVVFTAFKPAELSNDLIMRTMTYPYTSTTSNVSITFLKNLPKTLNLNELELVTSLEREFGASPSDPSINEIQWTHNYDDSNNYVNFSSQVFQEGLLRSFRIPIIDADVLAPLISWNSPRFGISRLPVSIKAQVRENSSFEIKGRYTEDDGITWQELPDFDIKEIEEGIFTITASIIPKQRGKLRVQLKIVDKSGNMRSIGYFNTTYAHERTSYGDEMQVAYHTPQIRILFPIYYLIPIVGAFLFLIWILIRDNKNIQKLRNTNLLEEEKEEHETEEENRISKIIRSKYNNFIVRVHEFKQSQAENPTRLYLLIGFLIMFLFSFILQSTFVYDYSDVTRFVFTDEYVLDHLQFIRRNSWFMTIYLIGLLGFLLVLTVTLKYKHKKQMPVYSGAIFLSIPFITATLQMFLHLLSSNVAELPALFAFYEVMNLYINPLMLIFHIIVVYVAIKVPRLFPDTIVNGYNQKAEQSEQKEKNAISEWIKTIMLYIWKGFSYLLLLAVLCYFSVIVFIDYFTHYWDGTAFGLLSSGQAYVIWCYYAFVIIFFAMISAASAIIFEILPKKMRVPWSLKSRGIL
ncbi:MAG: hypothetical protein GF364_06790, partial [Candidatus Lokiarchaeota archaeon]|nr:hypothetical protein [Candidatus Lokiarchaeota archaeon]